MIDRGLIRVVFLLLAAASLAQPLGVLLCSETCAGGTCETPPLAEFLDLDATGGLCATAPPAAEPVLANPGDPQLTGTCKLCPCFTAGQIDEFLVTEKTGERKWSLDHVTTSRPVLVAASTAVSYYPVCPSDINAHGPPLYRLQCALLI